MLLEMMKSKIHRAKVTEANPEYVGSVTIDAELMEQAGILPNEKVQICNCTNGSRLETYVIQGERHSGVICINGAAAHLVDPEDIVIIIAYGYMTAEEAKEHKPSVIFVNSENQPVEKANVEIPGEIKGC